MTAIQERVHTLTFHTVHVTKVNEGRKRGLFTSQHNQQQHNNKQNSSTLHPNLSLTHDLSPFLRFAYGLVRCKPLCLESALQAQVVVSAVPGVDLRRVPAAPKQSCSTS